MKTYYFGCGLSEKGHYWFVPLDGNLHHINMRELPLVLGNIAKTIDGTLCPTNAKQGIINRWLLESECSTVWTFIAFNDYSVDTRPGSNSVFIFEGNYDTIEACKLIDKYYPKIANRLITTETK